MSGAPSEPSGGQLRRRAPLIVAVLVLVLLFGFSVFTRLPAMDIPLSANRHGEGTARVMRHIRIWEEVGLSETRFMMRTTHTAPGDRYIRDIGYLPDDQGVYYYVSFPPLFALAPYVALQATGVKANPRSIRWFNIFLQAVGAMGMFLLGRRVFRDLGENGALLAGSVAAGVYIVTPMMLWYHSAAYVSTSLSTPLFVFATYFAVRLLHDDAPGRWPMAGFIVSLGLLAYTEWLSVMFALAVVGWALIGRKDVARRRVAVTAVAVVGVVTLLTVAQYSTVAGLSALVEGAGGKYVLRSGYVESSHARITSGRDWAQLGLFYWLAFSPLLILPAYFALSAFSVGSVRTGMRRLLSGPLATALWLSAVATVLHHLVFFSHTVLHDFDTMRTVVPVGLLTALLVTSGFAVMRRGSSMRHASTALALVVVVATLASYAWSAEKNFQYAKAPQVFGRAVRDAQVAPDEVVFVQGEGFYAGSAATYYARRNLAKFRDAEEAAEIMELSGASGGVLFTVDPDAEQVDAGVSLGLDGMPVASSTGTDAVIP